MPRIQAATVAEHRAARLRALLDAGRAVVTETGRPPTLGAVAGRAGMARPSVYEYFSSSDDLLAALAEDITPRWTARVVPLSDALTDLGAEPVPVVVAAIDGMVRATARTIEEGIPLDAAWPTVAACSSRSWSTTRPDAGCPPWPRRGGSARSPPSGRRRARICRIPPHPRR